MQIQGSHTFAAPRQAVWDALLDPTVLSMALPGGEQLVKVNENEYKASMRVKVGPVQGKFEGKVELSNINLLNSYTMKVSGTGAPGFLNGAGDVTLKDVISENGKSGTLMSYVGDAQVGGKIAGVGQRLIESTAKSIIRQGLTALDAQIQARVAAQPVVEAVTGSAASTVAAVESTQTAVSEAVSATATTAQSTASSTAAQPTAVSSPAAASVAASAIAGATTVSTPASFPAAAPKVVLPPRPAGPSAMQIGMEVAKDVSRDILSDVIPLKNQEKALWFTVGALAMLIFVILVKLVA